MLKTLNQAKKNKKQLTSVATIRMKDLCTNCILYEIQ